MVLVDSSEKLVQIVDMAPFSLKIYKSMIVQAPQAAFEAFSDLTGPV